jgi:Carboxypeptidase regulatory-like domain/PDZ domain
MMIAVRRVVVGLVLVAIAIGIWLWHGHHDVVTSSSSKRGSVASIGSASTIDARARLAWLAQHGVGARRVAGVVVFDTAPLAGATVRLASKLSAAHLVPELQVVTDASGAFDLGLQLPTDLVVAADAPHLTGVAKSIDLRDPTLVADKLTLVVHACDASIHGTIHDNGGGVVAKARVSQFDGEVPVGGAVADDRGAYELCVPVGASAVAVHAEGYAVVEENITATGHMPLDFTLSPEASVVGHVIRASDRSPVEGAVVELSNTPTLYASSDATGRFTVAGARTGRQMLTVTADHLATEFPIFIVATVASTNEVVCPLVSTWSVSGKVVDEGNRPAPGVAVQLAAIRRNLGRTTSATSQADGSFTIEHVLPDEYAIQARGLRDYMQRVKVESANLDSVVVEIKRGGSISGRVTHDGKPVEGTSITLDGGRFSTTTDRDGHFSVAGVEAGTWHVYAESKRIGAFSSGPTIKLADGEHRTGVDIELDQSASIAGTVVDQNDRPVGGLLLNFSLLHGEDSGLATTSDDGSFNATGLSGGGDYELDVRAGESSTRYSPLVGKRFAPVALKPGAHVSGVRIKARIDQLAISGRVIDASGKPVPDIYVEAWSENGHENEAASPASDANGHFEIEGLTSGTYRLGPRGAGEKRQSVAAGRKDVVIQLSDSGGIDGSLEGLDDLRQVIVDESYETYATVTGTTFQVRDVPPGIHHIIAVTREGTGFATVTVVANAIAKVVVKPTEHGSIVGVVSNATTPFECGAYTSYDHPSAGSWEPPPRVTSDSNGRFLLQRVVAGDVSVMCSSADTDLRVNASASATVIANQETHVELPIRPYVDKHRGHAGLVLEDQLGEVMVQTVEAESAAAKAGIVVGDIVIQVDDKKIELDRSGAYYVLQMIERRPAGSTVKLVLDRGDQQIVVSLTID